MKKITMLLGFLLFFSEGFSQERNSALEMLLERYNEIPENGSSPNTYFTIDELSVLKSHFRKEERQIAFQKNGGDIFFANDSKSFNASLGIFSLTSEIINPLPKPSKAILK